MFRYAQDRAMTDPEISPKIAELLKKHGVDRKQEIAPVELNNIAEASTAFEANTMAAIAKIRQILALDPKPYDEHYEGILRAQAQVANNQICAQLRVAEGRLKAAAIERDYFTELREALANYRENEN